MAAVDDPRTALFIAEITTLCLKHNLSISHEDGHGAFKIERYTKSNIEWLGNAYVLQDEDQVARLAAMVEVEKENVLKTEVANIFKGV